MLMPTVLVQGGTTQRKEDAVKPGAGASSLCMEVDLSGLCRGWSN